jgi:hypothetical protein
MVCRVTRTPSLAPLSAAIACLGAFIAIGAVVSATAVVGESSLPSCPGGEIASWTNCQGTSAYPNGGTYVGEFRDGKPNGLGTLTYRRHGEYVGEFRDSWPSGRGSFTYPDGRRYVGEWRNGDFNGRGVRTYPDGRKEDGEWSGGKLTRSAEENLPQSDAPEKPRAAAGDASEINQSKPVVLTGNDIFDGALLLLMVFLVLGAVIAAVFGVKAKSPESAALSAATPGRIDGAGEQSDLDEAQRALLEAVEDFTVSDANLLEMRASARRAFKERKNLERKAAARRILNVLKLW